MYIRTYVRRYDYWNIHTCVLSILQGYAVHLVSCVAILCVLTVYLCAMYSYFNLM